MTASATMALDAVIDVLRSVPTEAARAPSVAQVRILIDDIWAMRHLASTAARPELSGFSELDLISIAELFGKHRARVYKTQLEGKRVRRESSATGALFNAPEEDIREARALLAQGIRPFRATPDKLGRRRPDHRFPRRLLPALEVADQDWGVLPGGYDRGEDHGRDVHVSLESVLALPVPDSEIIRFVDRTYSAPKVTLDGDHVRLLHWLVSNGLSVKLLELAGQRAAIQGGKAVLVATGRPANPTLAHLMVQAYDLLDVARADAVRALGRVVRGGVTDAGGVRAELCAAQWLAPGPIGHLIQLAERTNADPDNERLQRIFTTAVGTFSRDVRSHPGTYVVRDVAGLNAAHLTQILTLSGLAVDDGQEKAAANELRVRLIELGLRNDLDRELPEALRAWRNGRLEEYFTSRQARLEGDPDWVRLYEADLALEVQSATAVA